MNKKRLLRVVAIILGAIGLGELNHMLNLMYWNIPWRDQWNWIDVHFDFKWFNGIHHVVWQVSLINCIIIFLSMLWFSWIFFVVSDELKRIGRKGKRKKYWIWNFEVKEKEVKKCH